MNSAQYKVGGFLKTIAPALNIIPGAGNALSMGVGALGDIMNDSQPFNPGQVLPQISNPYMLGGRIYQNGGELSDPPAYYTSPTGEVHVGQRLGTGTWWETDSEPRFKRYLSLEEIQKDLGKDNPKFNSMSPVGKIKYATAIAKLWHQGAFRGSQWDNPADFMRHYFSKDGGFSPNDIERLQWEYRKILRPTPSEDPNWKSRWVKQQLTQEQEDREHEMSLHPESLKQEKFRQTSRAFQKLADSRVADALGEMDKRQKSKQGPYKPSEQKQENPFATSFPEFKFGGPMKQYNAPTHAQGGQMIDGNGNPSFMGAAEIEKRETYSSFGPGDGFVFSDALTLPNGMTLAEKAAEIEKKYGKKNDTISKDAKERELKKLAEYGESLKMQMAQQQQSLKMQGGGPYNWAQIATKGMNSILPFIGTSGQNDPPYYKLQQYHLRNAFPQNTPIVTDSPGRVSSTETQLQPTVAIQPNSNAGLSNYEIMKKNLANMDEPVPDVNDTFPGAPKIDLGIPKDDAPVANVHDVFPGVPPLDTGRNFLDPFRISDASFVPDPFTTIIPPQGNTGTTPATKKPTSPSTGTTTQPSQSSQPVDPIANKRWSAFGEIPTRTPEMVNRAKEYMSDENVASRNQGFIDSVTNEGNAIVNNQAGLRGLSTLNAIAAALKGGSLLASGFDAFQKPEIQSARLPNFAAQDQYFSNLGIDPQTILNQTNLQRNAAVQDASRASGNYGQFMNRVNAIMRGTQQAQSDALINAKQFNDQMNITAGNRGDRNAGITSQMQLQADNLNAMNRAQTRNMRRNFLGQLSQAGSTLNQIQFLEDQVKNQNELASMTTKEFAAALGLMTPAFSVPLKKIGEMNNEERKQYFSQLLLQLGE